MNKKKLKKVVIIPLLVILITLVTAHVVIKVKAEQLPGTPDSGVSSRIKALYDELETLGYGSDSDTTDWGTLWNRIKTASRWAPDTTATANDVKEGKTFTTANSRGESVGTYPAPSSCPTEAWHDLSVLANQVNNCTDTIIWTNPDDMIVGTDKQDPRTGLIWSHPLRNNNGTVEFSETLNSAWSWNNAATNNVAVGEKTAIELCSERGNGWRLPTQKELIQAYIDGSYWNLSLSNKNGFWSATEYDASSAWRVNLGDGGSSSKSKSSANEMLVRCVR